MIFNVRAISVLKNLLSGSACLKIRLIKYLILYWINYQSWMYNCMKLSKDITYTQKIILKYLLNIQSPRLLCQNFSLKYFYWTNNYWWIYSNQVTKVNAWISIECFLYTYTYSQLWPLYTCWCLFYIQCVLYLYKSLFKGRDHTGFRVSGF